MLKKLRWKMLLRWTVTIGILIWFFLNVDWRQISRGLIGISPLWLVAATAGILFSVLVSAIKWRLLLNAQGLNISKQFAWEAYWTGLFCNNFLPSSIGGDAARIMLTSKETGNHSGAAASVIIERILASIGLVVVGLSAIIWVSVDISLTLVIYALIIVVSSLLLVVLMHGKIPRMLNHSNKLIAFLIALIRHGEKIRKQPKTVFVVLGLSVCFQLGVVVVNFCVFRALHVDNISWAASMYVIPLASAAAMLPFGINGYGVREGAYAILLAPFGVDKESALLASMFFAVLVSVCSLWGGWVWLKRFNRLTIDKQEKSMVAK